MWRQVPEHSAGQERKETGRLEALSDGVFAIAMTLLVLGIPIPTAEKLAAQHLSLRAAVMDHTAWLPFLTYAISFLTILVMWINHHYIFQFVARIDRYFVVANGLLLMVIVFVNYPTALAANFIGTADGEFAAIAYNVTLVAASILYNALWFRIISHRRLLVADADPAEVASYTRQYLIGGPMYVVALGLAFVNPGLSIALDAALAIFWAFTGKTTRTQVRYPAQPATEAPGATPGGRER
ncbi:MAG TPA: TMEM175 family protein [Ktedonobacterales bacterium]